MPQGRAQPVLLKLTFTASDSENIFAEIHLFICVQKLFGRDGNRRGLQAGKGAEEGEIESH